jgi:hypothetical protein
MSLWTFDSADADGNTHARVEGYTVKGVNVTGGPFYTVDWSTGTVSGSYAPDKYKKAGLVVDTVATMLGTVSQASEACGDCVDRCLYAALNTDGQIPAGTLS